MTFLTIDADIVAFRCAASAENDNEEIAKWRVDELMNRILYETAASRYSGYLSGNTNFRHEIYPEYKANRKDKVRPKYLEACREFLVSRWHCKVTDGIEADDALGIDHQQEPGAILASIDKDLLQLPGRHYNFVKAEWRTVSPVEGLRNFYTQLIEGDATDNIPAFDGKFRHSRPKFVQKLIDPLYEMTEAKDMCEHASILYDNHLGKVMDYSEVDKLLERNAHLLYIQKREGDKWKDPRQNTIMESGQQEDLEASLSLYSEAEQGDGPPSIKL